MIKQFRGIRPDDPHGRRALRNPERGFRTEMYFSMIPGEIAGTCSCHSKRNKLDGRSESPVYQNVDIPGVPHLIRGNRLDAIEFSHGQWQDELDFFAYDGVTIMQSYCFLMKYDDGRPIPQQKLDDIETFLQKLRLNGVKTLLRFAYELSPKLTGPTAETTLNHLQQLKPILRKYKDVIYVLQCGFTGTFGEWHNSFHSLHRDVPFRRELMSAVLEALPDDRRTMMRYPILKMQLYGTEPLKPERAFTMDPEARIGHFNDGFLANPPSHGGTFKRHDSILPYEEEMKYVEAESRFLPIDGELFWYDVGGLVLPQEATKLLNRWNYDTFGFVHGNQLFEGGTVVHSIDAWKRVPIDPMFIIDQKLPLDRDYFTDYRGEHVWRSYYEYIRDHLGYRLQLTSADIPETAVRNAPFKADFNLINRGFSSPVNKRPVQLVLKNNDGTHSLPIHVDIQRWYGNETQSFTLETTLPESVKPGIYQVGLAFPDAAETLADNPEYAIHLANDLVFKDGVNWLDMTTTVA